MQAKTVILVGGAGVVGRQVAAILRRRQPDVRLILAGRGLEAAQAAAAPLGAEAMRLDVQAPDLGEVNTDTIIVGLANDLNDRLLTAAVRAGTSYLDVTRWTAAQQQALTTVAALGRPVAPVVFASSWMASTVGLAVRDAARDMASIERIDIGILFGLGDRAGPNSVAYMDRISIPFATMEEGGWRTRRGFRDGQARDFGEGGIHTVYRFDTPDQAVLPALTGARTVDARIAFDARMETRLVHILAASGVWKALSGPRFETLRRSVLYNPGEGAAHRVRIGLEGRDGQGEAVRRTVQLVDPEGQTRLTALGAVVQIERLLGRLGPALEAGVHLGEAMADPAPAIALLRSEGVRIEG